MLYLRNTTDAQVLMIPRNGDDSQHSALTLTIINTITQQHTEIPVCDIHTSELYWNCAVELLPGTDSGEYKYELREGELICSSGLLIIGSETSRYDYEQKITYKQYDAE